MIKEIKKLEEKKINNVEVCKGLFWRGSINTFLSEHRSLEHRKSLRLLKRISCKGCDKCYWLWDYLSEDISCNEGIDYIGKIKHGAIYTYQVNSSKGYYDAYPEIDDIEFVEVKDKAQ